MFPVDESKETNYYAGFNGMEFFGIKGTHQILVYDCEEFPKPPCEIIQYHKRIQTKYEFEDALYNGMYLATSYVKDGD